MSNGTSKQSGVGKFLSGPLGGVAVQGGLGLIGGILGGIIELQDLYSGKYSVKIHQSATGTEATPFSAAV